jgi:hypothetical protein
MFVHLSWRTKMLGVKFKAMAVAIIAALTFAPAMVKTASAVPLAQAGQVTPETNTEKSELLVDVARRGGGGHYRVPNRGGYHGYRYPNRRYGAYPNRRYGAYPYRRYGAYPYRRHYCGRGYYNCRRPAVRYAVPFYGYGAYGAYYDNYNYYDDSGYYGGNDHVQWCLNRYRSYDPRSDTFLGYDGHRHVCNSPY